MKNMDKKLFYTSPACNTLHLQGQTMILEGSLNPLTDDSTTIEWIMVP